MWSFNGKFDIAANMPDSIFAGIWKKPVLAVNNARNGFGHNLNVIEITETDVNPIRKFLSFWPQTAKLSAIDLIQLFVAVLALCIEAERTIKEKEENLNKKQAELDKEWLAMLEEKSQYLDQLFGESANV